jgi:hypothetical protein
MKPVQDRRGTVWLDITKAVLRASAATRRATAATTEHCPHKIAELAVPPKQALLSILTGAERTLPETNNLFGNFSVIAFNSSFRFRR